MRLFTILVLLTALSSWMCVAFAVETTQSAKPNIVLIFVDDLGYGDVGCYGATKVKTPNIDKLAEQGRRLLDAHSASAVCTPSRYALLTGAYPYRGNVWGPRPNSANLVIADGQETMASVLKKQGYATTAIGKWHLGFGRGKKVDWNKDLKPGPLECGFDTYFGIPVVNSSTPYVWVENYRVVGLDPADPLVYGGTPKTTFYPEKTMNGMSGAVAAHDLYKEDQVGITLAERAINWMKEKKDQPFFLYFATPHIHHPFTPQARFKGTSECGIYGDFIHELDWMVGEVIRTLDELELSEKTLVILTSDNGGMINIGGQEAVAKGHHMNGKLLGFKFDVWEGGHRVPFIARWPGKITPGTVSNQLMCHVDLFASFAALSGATLQPADGPDSFNQLATIMGTSETAVRDHVILSPFKESHVSLREKQWMYIGNKGGGGWTASKVGKHIFGGPAAIHYGGGVNSDMKDGDFIANAPDEQLYDLANDPNQTKNLIVEHPDIAARMKARLQELRSQPRTAP